MMLRLLVASTLLCRGACVLASVCVRRFAWMREASVGVRKQQAGVCANLTEQEQTEGGKTVEATGATTSTTRARKRKLG